MRPMDPPDSFIHMAANADIDVRLKERGIENIYTKDNGIADAIDAGVQAEAQGAETDRVPNAAGEAFSASLVPAPDALHKTSIRNR